jgi:hypothetical protein
VKLFARAAPVLVLSWCACTRAEPKPVEVVDTAEPALVVEAPPPTAAPSDASVDLDHTLWDCEWSLAVFWASHWHRAHRDVVRATMGGSGLFAREDYDLAWGPRGEFTVTLRHVDYPTGERNPEDFDDAPSRTFTYVRDGDTLEIRGFEDGEPLECVRACYDVDFIEFMDARYGTRTDPATTTDQRRTPGCP